MLLAGANVLYLTLFDEVWALGPGDNAPMSAKLVAASQVCCGSASFISAGCFRISATRFEAGEIQNAIRKMQTRRDSRRLCECRRVFTPCLRARGGLHF